jgi:hypothetical protein
MFFYNTRWLHTLICTKYQRINRRDLVQDITFPGSFICNGRWIVACLVQENSSCNYQDNNRFGKDGNLVMCQSIVVACFIPVSR